MTYVVNEADNQVRLFVEVMSGTLEGTVTVLFTISPISASESGILVYSGTSDKGPSGIGTTSQQRTHFWTPFPWQ